MKKSHAMLMIVVLAGCLPGRSLLAQDRAGGGELRGVFVRLAERQVGEREYMAIVVKPFDSDDHVTVLVPQERVELARSARTLQEGDRLEVSFAEEHGEMWVSGLAVQRRRTEREREAAGNREVEIRREIRLDPQVRVERREGDPSPEARRQTRRPAERPRAERERDPDGRTPVRREGRGEPDRPREPGAPSEMFERQLREVVARHMERLGGELREILQFQIESMRVEIRELRAHTENMQRELEMLRAENERLRRQLAERGNRAREGDVEAPGRPERDRRDREVRTDVERNRTGDGERRREEGDARRDPQRDKSAARDRS